MLLNSIIITFIEEYSHLFTCTIRLNVIVEKLPSDGFVYSFRWNSTFCIKVRTDYGNITWLFLFIYYFPTLVFTLEFVVSNTQLRVYFKYVVHVFETTIVYIFNDWLHCKSNFKQQIITYVWHQQKPSPIYYNNRLFNTIEL